MKNKGIAAAGVAVVLVLIIAVAGVGAFLLLRRGPSITGKKVLLIIAPTDFNDTEYGTTRSVLEQAGATVSVASTTTETARSDETQVTPDLAITDVNVGNYDAVVFIGGMGVETAYFDNITAQQIASNAYNQGKVVGAICIAPVVLAKAGILNGKHATVYNDYAAQLTAGGAIYTDQPVVTEGKIITANGPDASTAFANAIVSALGA